VDVPPSPKYHLSESRSFTTDEEKFTVKGTMPVVGEPEKETSGG